MNKHMSIAPYVTTASNALPTTDRNNGATALPQASRNKLQNVPAFLNKLYSMVNDSSTDDLIKWADDGQSFIVSRYESFAKTVLPRFFKHSNFSSFVRQLNMYGFHKVPHLQNGTQQTADNESEEWEFSNPHFQRNQPDLLLLVTRKRGRDVDDKESSGIDMHHILDEISAIKRHQMSISTRLRDVQQENQLLWQEAVQSRDKFQRHQETIDKILRFLASVFYNDKKRPSIPRKRRFLIGDSDGSHHQTMDEQDAEDGAQADDIMEFVNTDAAANSERLASLTSNTEPLTELGPLSSVPTPPGDYPTNDLAAAIALNNKTKEQCTLQQQPKPQSPQLSSQLPDLSALLNHPSLRQFLSADPATTAALLQCINPFSTPSSMPSSVPDLSPFMAGMPPSSPPLPQPHTSFTTPSLIPMVPTKLEMETEPRAPTWDTETPKPSSLADVPEDIQVDMNEYLRHYD